MEVIIKLTYSDGREETITFNKSLGSEKIFSLFKGFVQDGTCWEIISISKDAAPELWSYANLAARIERAVKENRIMQINGTWFLEETDSSQAIGFMTECRKNGPGEVIQDNADGLIITFT